MSRLLAAALARARPLAVTAGLVAYVAAAGHAQRSQRDGDPGGVGVTPISHVQGDGLASPLVGAAVRVVGVVTADFQGAADVGLGGFFVQEEPADADTDPATSEGLWVYQGEHGVDVAPGDVVAVSGEVVEFGGLTQLAVRGEGADVDVVGTAPLPPPVVLAASGRGAGDLERREGMRVTFAETPTLTDLYDLGRFGVVRVALGKRPAEFTECNAPDSAALAAYDSAVSARTFLLDDGRGGEGLPPRLGARPLARSAGELRAGNGLPALVGVLDERYGGYRVQVTEAPEVALANPRPVDPPAVGGEIRVASVNALNYFNGDGRGGGFPTARGAETYAAFLRQEAKLVAAICALEADVLGLAEVENDGYGPASSVRALTAAISSACGLAYEPVASPDDGTDAIRVALLHRPDVVEVVGRPATLTEPAELFAHSRVPLAASFTVVAPEATSRGETFTVAVNHLRSKGGSCAGSGIPGDDARDGSGRCDGTRTALAEATVAWLETAPTGVDDPDVLVVGDLNAYRRERPVTTFLAAGYVDVVAQASSSDVFPCGGAATFAYRGRWGSLDHAFASESLAPQVTGAGAWGVNAAEPASLSYRDSSLYAPDVYRFSDHDPLVVGLSLRATTTAQSPAGAGTPSPPLRRIATRTYCLDGADAHATYALLDSTGRRTALELDADGSFGLPAHLPAGAYFLRVRRASGAVEAFRLIAE